MKSLNNYAALFILVIFSFFSCSGTNIQSGKITFDLSGFTEDGLRKLPRGEFGAINYEFCIPAEDKSFNEVRAIDTTLVLLKGSKGRSGCTDNEWLCIGSS